MSTDIERKVGNLLNSSTVNVPVETSSSTSGETVKVTANRLEEGRPLSVLEIDSSSEKHNIELKERQEKMRVHVTC